MRAERERVAREAVERVRDELARRLESDRALTDQIAVSLESERDVMRAELEHLRTTFDLEAHRAELTADEIALDDTAQDQRTASTVTPGREEPPESTSDTFDEPSIVTGWLRRVFGRS